MGQDLYTDDAAQLGLALAGLSLGRVYTPEKYGAVGGSAADDTAAVQAAINAAGAAGGGVVLFSKLHYVTTLNCDFPNVRFAGGQRGRLFDNSGMGGLRQRQGTTGPLLTIGLNATAGAVDNVLFHGDGNNQTATNDAVVFTPTADGSSVETSWTFRESRFVYFKGRAVLQGLARRGMRFTNNQIYACLGGGLRLEGSDNLVTGNFIGGCPAAYGVEIRNWTQTISDNDIWDCLSNIWILSGNRYVNIIGNKLDRSRSSAIYIVPDATTPAQGINIIGNVFHENVLGATAAPVIFYGGDNGCIIGNHFGDTATANVANYCIIVPTTTLDGRHHISGNTTYGIPAANGLLQYRGSSNWQETIPRSAKYFGTRNEFAAGFGCTPLAVQPTIRWIGLTVLADRVGWDPLAKAAGGAYWVWWSGTVWLAPQTQG